ncbi:ESPR-type extended signal peptide-containing protein, partial [Paraburkholderia tropica]
MNKTRYRLVFNRTRGMPVAVEEPATGVSPQTGHKEAYAYAARVAR